eukprot:scaffold676_cov316-Pavlova_lutheri.AAC.55
MPCHVWSDDGWKWWGDFTSNFQEIVDGKIPGCTIALLCNKNDRHVRWMEDHATRVKRRGLELRIKCSCPEQRFILEFPFMRADLARQLRSVQLLLDIIFGTGPIGDRGRLPIKMAWRGKRPERLKGRLVDLTRRHRIASSRDRRNCDAACQPVLPRAPCRTSFQTRSSEGRTAVSPTERPKRTLAARESDVEKSHRNRSGGRKEKLHAEVEQCRNGDQCRGGCGIGEMQGFGARNGAPRGQGGGAVDQ